MRTSLLLGKELRLHQLILYPTEIQLARPALKEVSKCIWSLDDRQKGLLRLIQLRGMAREVDSLDRQEEPGPHNHARVGFLDSSTYIFQSKFDFLNLFQ